MLCIGSCHDLPVTRSILAAQSISAWDPIGTLKGSLCGSLRFVLVDAARSGRLKRPVWMLGLGMPVVLTVVAVVYVTRGTIGPVYLLDAAAETVLAAWWIVVLARTRS